MGTLKGLPEQQENTGELKMKCITYFSKGEDKTHISVDNAPEILSLMNKWALNIVKHNKVKDSVKRVFDKIKMNPKRIMTLITQF